MNKGIALKSTLLLGFIATFLGGLFKILHYAGADIIMRIGLVFSAIFLITALIEILSSKHFKTSEKILWSLALFFTLGIGGIIYLLVGRKQIAALQKESEYVK